MVIHERNERELQKNMSSKDLRAEDITGSGSYLGAIYQEEANEAGGGKFKMSLSSFEKAQHAGNGRQSKGKVF